MFILIFGLTTWLLLLFFAYKKYKSYSKNTDMAWKNASDTTGCSVTAIKYWFHNYSWGAYKWLRAYQDGPVSTRIGLMNWWIGKDTEILQTYQAPRYQIKEHILITNNYTHSVKIFHHAIYYFTNICWIISIIIIPLTMGISIFCMIILAIMTAQSSSYMNFIRTLGKQSMESLWFEKSFDAFSRDPVEARMIITPAFMDRLEQFSEKWNLKWKIRIIWEKDTFTLLLKWDIEKYWKESDGSYTLIKSMEEILNLEYYSLPLTNTNNG